MKKRTVTIVISDTDNGDTAISTVIDPIPGPNDRVTGSLELLSLLMSILEESGSAEIIGAKIIRKSDGQPVHDFMPPNQ